MSHTNEEPAVQKGLCIATLAIAIITFLFFLADFLLGFMEMSNLAPFKYAGGMTIDIVFIVCSLVLAILSFFTLKEQV